MNSAAWPWIVQHWKLWGISSIAVAVAGAMKWVYVIRKARADALAAETERKRGQIALQEIHNSQQEHSTVDARVIETLANGASWGKDPMTGAGDRLLRVNEIAETLSLGKDVVADSLERLEAERKVKQHGGTLDNPLEHITEMVIQVICFIRIDRETIYGDGTAWTHTASEDRIDCPLLETASSPEVNGKGAKLRKDLRRARPIGAAATSSPNERS